MNLSTSNHSFRGDSVSSSKISSKRMRERGNIFFTLFGAVAIVGVLGAGIMSTMRGPLSTMVEVNRIEEAKAEMRLGARLILAKSTDVDESPADGMVEGVNPATNVSLGVTVIPATVSAEKNDPWGTPYQYCAWNHGDGTGTNTDALGNRFAGSTDPNNPAIVVISAGRDRSFDTGCADDPDYLTNSSGTALTEYKAQGDDIMEMLSYADAVTASGGLWKLKSGDTSKATIDKDLAVTTNADFQGQVRFDTQDPLAMTSASVSSGLVIPTDSAYLATDCDGDDQANHGLVRINESTTPDTLELCDNTAGAWKPVGEGVAEWTNDGSGNISHDGGNVSTTQNLTVGGSATVGSLDAGSGAIATTGTLNAGASTLGDTDVSSLDSSGAITGTTITGSGLVKGAGLESTSGLTVSGASDLNGALDVSGSTTLGDDAATDTLTIKGNTTATGDLTLTGDTSLTGDLSVSGTTTLADVDASTLDTTGDVTIGGTLGVTGATTLSSTLDVTGTLTATDGVVLGDRTTCTAGAIRYHGSKVQYCDGSNWKGFSIDKLRDIDNVDITSDPTDKYMIMWNDSAKKWVAVDPGTLEVADATSADEADEARSLWDDAEAPESDGDTGIEVDTAGDGTANTIVFTNNNNQSMIIDANGNVGIGTASPADVLDVVGHITTRGAVAGLTLQPRGGSGSTFTLLNNAGDRLQVATSGVGTHAVFMSDGRVGIGIMSPDASSILDVTSTTKGFLPPRMTEVQRNSIAAPAAGLQVYNTTSNMLEYWDGTQWATAGGAGGGLSCTDEQIMVYDAGAGEWKCGGLGDVDDGSDPGGDWVSVNGAQVKLTASDGAADDEFGYAVAIDGNTAVVGMAKDDDGGTQSGSAYVFVRSGTTWSEQAKLTASDPAGWDNFGVSVSVSGDTVVIGADSNDDDGSESGSAYVFVRSGTTWSEQTKLTASDAAAGAYFGQSIVLDGDTVVVGAPEDDSGRGAAYVFTRSGTTWSEQAKLTASDAASWDEFGQSVSLDGDTALVGSWYDDDDGADSGSVYVFTRSGTTWSEQTKLKASDASVDSNLGAAVSLSSDTAVVGAGGVAAAYVFVRSGSTWSEQAKLAAPGGYVDSASVEGDVAIIGVPADNAGGISQSGSVVVFTRSGTSWTEQVKLTASDAAVQDWLGVSASLSGNLVIAGAFEDDDKGAESGSAYVFDLTSGLGSGGGPVVSSAGKIIDEDGDTQIQVEETADDDMIRFDTAGVERMVIDAAGHIGIAGSPIDQSSLTVAGSISVNGSDADFMSGGMRAFVDLRDETSLHYARIGAVQGGGSVSPGLALIVGTGSEAVFIESDGRVGVGTSSPDASSLLDVTSTTQGFLPPRMTAAERDAIAAPAMGLQVYNTTDKELQCYNGSVWKACSDISAGGTGVVSNGDSCSANSLTLAGSLTAASLDGAKYMEMRGNHVFMTAANAKALTIVDISNPTSPVEVASLVDTAKFDDIRAVKLRDNYAYVVAHTSDSFTVVDISDPTNPLTVTSISGTELNGANDLKISGNYAYVVSGSNDRLASIDISDPTNPAIVDYITTTDIDGAVGVYVEGNYAYVASLNSDALTIFDISDPSDLTQVGTISTANTADATDVYVTGGYAYVSSKGANALTVIDVSDPTNPSEVGSVTSPELNGSYGVTYYDGQVFVTANSAGALTIVDVSDPTSPTQVTSLAGLNSSFGVALGGRYAYVSSAGDDALYVVDTGCNIGADVAAAAKLVDNDGDTKVQVEEGLDDDTIRFDTAGKERMVIDEKGNVRIGATDMSGTRLNVVGVVQLEPKPKNDVSSMQTVLNLVTSGGDGSTPMNVVGATGWHIFARGSSWATPDQAGALGIASFDGTSFKQSFVIRPDTGGVAIGDIAGVADDSSVLDLYSTTKGFLPPRMTEAQRDAIAAPATGLVVYNTDGNALEYYDGTQWVPVGGGGSTVDPNAWCTGLSGTVSGSNCVFEFSSPGTTNWTVPEGITGTINVELWGAGGSGGHAYNGGAAGQGGYGGQYVQVAVDVTSLNATEPVVVGTGGAGTAGNSAGTAGTFSMFADSYCAEAGASGAGQHYASVTPVACSPSETRTGVVQLTENGGAGGNGLTAGGNATYAGGGGGGMVNDQGGRPGGTSTNGGDGGAGADGVGEDAQSPAGGGGACEADSAGNVSGSGGDGMVRISIPLSSAPSGSVGGGGSTASESKGLTASGVTMSIADSVDTDVVFDTTDRNDFGSGDWDGSSFTVPSGEDGWYVITADLRIQAVNSNLQLEIRKNGTTISRARDVNDTGGTSVFYINASKADYLNAGDVIKVVAKHKSGSTENLSGGHLSVVKMGAGGSSSSSSAAGELVEVTATGLSASGSGVINFGTEVADGEDWFDLSTDRFQPTVAGKYLVNAHLEYDAVSDTDYMYVQLRKNGSTNYYVTFDRAPSTSNQAVAGSYVVEMNGTTDYLEVMHSSGSGTIKEARVQFMGLNGSSSSGTGSSTVDVAAEGFRAEGSSDTITAGDVAITFDNVIENDFGAGAWDGQTFTVPADKGGWYSLSGGAGISNISGNIRPSLHMRLNGTLLVQTRDFSDQGGTYGHSMNISTLYKLDAGDEITLVAYINDTVSHTIGSSKNTYLSLVRLDGSATVSGTGSSTTASDLIAFEAKYDSGDVSLADAAWTDLTGFTQQVEEGGDNFDPSAGTFTAPEDGFYQFNMYLSIQDAGKHPQIFVGKQGASTMDDRVCYVSSYRDTPGTTDGHLACSGVINLTQNDVIVFRAYQASGASQIVTGGKISGFKVGSGGGSGVTSSGSALSDVAFRLWGSSQTVDHDTDTPLTSWGTEDVSALGDSTYSNGVLTIGAEDAGWWVLTAGLSFSDGVSRNRVTIRKNGSQFISSSGDQQDQTTGDYTIRPVTTSVVVELAEGDQIDVVAWQRNTTLANGKALNGLRETFFSGVKVQAGGGSGSGSDTLSSLSCTSGQVPAWNGSAWACADGGTGGSSDPIAFDAYLSSNQSIADSTWTTVLWDAITNETGGSNFNTSTGIFVAPEDGYYNFSTTIRWEAAAGEARHVSIYNGTQSADICSTGDTRDSSLTNGLRTACSGSAYLSAGDEVWVSAHHSSAGNVNALTSAGKTTRFSGFKVGAGGGAADNLGDHTATEDLDMAGFEIDAAGAITLDSVSGAAEPVGVSNLWVSDGTNVYRESGNVGIGTDSPERSLHIVGTGGASDDIIFESNTDSGNSSLLTQWRSRGTNAAKTAVLAGDLVGYWDARAWTGSVYKQIAAIQMRAEEDMATEESGYIRFDTRDNGSASERMRITSDGNVGIGTEDPAVTLTVVASADIDAVDSGNEGAILIRNSADTHHLRIDPNEVQASENGSAGSLTINPFGGTVIVGSSSIGANLQVRGTSTTCTLGDGTGTTSCSSDIRLKKNVVPLEGSLDKIAALEGVSFDWKKSDEHAIGVIAQEVEKVFPEVVTTDEETGYKSVAYASLVAPLIESVKELKSENEELRARVENMAAPAAGDGPLGLSQDAMFAILAALMALIVAQGAGVLILLNRRNKGGRS